MIGRCSRAKRAATAAQNKKKQEQRNAIEGWLKLSVPIGDGWGGRFPLWADSAGLPSKVRQRRVAINRIADYESSGVAHAGSADAMRRVYAAFDLQYE